ncbi:MAG TPA: CBS domain-containing protein [Nitrososphaerales archaeon]|nr:CBS domain-containing protein [Nitrososphaerales archaeon]
MIYVKDVMTRNVRTIGEEGTISAAAKVMSKWKIGALVIVDGNKPTGMLTEGDISRLVAKGLDPRVTPVTIGRRKLVTVSPGERIEAAAKIMADAGVKKLPVIEEGKLVGILTQTDIVNSSFALVTSLKEMVQARYRPPDFQM